MSLVDSIEATRGIGAVVFYLFIDKNLQFFCLVLHFFKLLGDKAKNLGLSFHPIKMKRSRVHFFRFTFSLVDLIACDFTDWLKQFLWVFCLTVMFFCLKTCFYLCQNPFRNVSVSS